MNKILEQANDKLIMRAKGKYQSWYERVHGDVPHQHSQPPGCKLAPSPSEKIQASPSRPQQPYFPQMMKVEQISNSNKVFHTSLIRALDYSSTQELRNTITSKKLSMYLARIQGCSSRFEIRREFRARRRFYIFPAKPGRFVEISYQFKLVITGAYDHLLTISSV